MLFFPPLRALTVAPCNFLLSVSILQRCADDTDDRGCHMDLVDDSVASARSMRFHDSCSETRLALSSWLSCLFWFPRLSDTLNWPRSFGSSCCPGWGRACLPVMCCAEVPAHCSSSCSCEQLQASVANLDHSRVLDKSFRWALGLIRSWSAASALARAAKRAFTL